MSTCGWAVQTKPAKGPTSGRHQELHLPTPTGTLEIQTVRALRTVLQWDGQVPASGLTMAATLLLTVMEQFVKFCFLVTEVKFN